MFLGVALYLRPLFFKFYSVLQYMQYVALLLLLLLMLLMLLMLLILGRTIVCSAILPSPGLKLATAPLALGYLPTNNCPY